MPGSPIGFTFFFFSGVFVFSMFQLVNPLSARVGVCAATNDLILGDVIADIIGLERNTKLPMSVRHVSS